MPRASAVCPQPGCPNPQPCPAHAPKPWAGSTRGASLGIPGWTLQRDRRRILARDKGVCHVCGQPGADQADHVVPLAEGGRHVDANLAAIHAVPCHQQKTLEEAQRARRRHSR